MDTRTETWAHRCIGELLESVSIVQRLEETDVLYKSERDQLVNAASEAARCLKELISNN